MSELIQAIRGMEDILPEDAHLWMHVEDSMRSVLHQYGYDHIRMPIVEVTELFARGVGETTDVVEKEMYTFADRNGLSLSLRPEGTAGCVRACEQHGLLYNQIQRLWYQGPMFRYEKPQKGRNRQFHQLGIEAFGMSEPDIDAEVIALTHRIWQQLRIDGALSLQLNTIGSTQSRLQHKKALVDYLKARRDLLDEDSLRRLETNPLRIFDSKIPSTQALLDGAPNLMDFIDDESAAHFEKVQALLTRLDIRFTVNPRLVRGLDYYNKTVFEWVTTALGAQGTVCGGGRYDGLVSQLGGRPTPAFGCGIGLERIMLMVKSLESAYHTPPRLDIFAFAVGQEAVDALLPTVERIRSISSALSIRMFCGTGKIAKLMKKADDSGAEYAMIIGDQELKEGTVTLKPLRGQGHQTTIRIEEVANLLRL